jgi:hypothetical protein
MSAVASNYQIYRSSIATSRSPREDGARRLRKIRTLPNVQRVGMNQGLALAVMSGAALRAECKVRRATADVSPALAFLWGRPVSGALLFLLVAIAVAVTIYGTIRWLQRDRRARW